MLAASSHEHIAQGGPAWERPGARPASPQRTTRLAVTVAETPLFPLRSVFFPGSHLSLRIFEPRYLDMV